MNLKKRVSNVWVVLAIMLYVGSGISIFIASKQLDKFEEILKRIDHMNIELEPKNAGELSKQ